MIPLVAIPRELSILKEMWSTGSQEAEQVTTAWRHRALPIPSAR